MLPETLTPPSSSKTNLSNLALSSGVNKVWGTCVKIGSPDLSSVT
jgi:hypothetical protein